MFKTFLTILVGLLVGSVIGIFLIFSTNENSTPISPINLKQLVQPAKKESLGFLPYWLLGNAKNDYSGFITTLDYFSLTLDTDGTILKSTTPVELEPGWYALTSGTADPFLGTAKSKNIKLSISIFDGDQASIDRVLDDPKNHAVNLVDDMTPVMSKYGFSDLNLDIESVAEATQGAQLKFAQFVSEVHNQMTNRNLPYTLSIDIAPIDFIKDNRLVKPELIEKYIDRIILMAYDFHSPSSFVTGPVAPLSGAGTVAEFDTKVGVEKALKVTAPGKILLGIPFYGYSWETIDSFQRAAIVPSSAVITSNVVVEDILAKCATCSAQFDEVAKESYVVYKDTDTNTYHQIFYPDKNATEAKVNFVNSEGLAGIAIWALGYEGSSIMNPIQPFLLYH